MISKYYFEVLFQNTDSANQFLKTSTHVEFQKDPGIEPNCTLTPRGQRFFPFHTLLILGSNVTKGKKENVTKWTNGVQNAIRHPGVKVFSEVFFYHIP